MKLARSKDLEAKVKIMELKRNGGEMITDGKNSKSNSGDNQPLYSGSD